MSAAYCSVQVTAGVVAHQLSRQGVDASSYTVCDQTLPALRHLGLLLHWLSDTDIQGGATSWDSSGSENTSHPGLRRCEPSGFGGNAWVIFLIRR